MIFALWYLIWVLSAGTLLAFLIPYLAIALRGTYINRRVTFLRRTHIWIALMVFVGLISVEENTLEYSMYTTLQVVAFMALTYHLMTRVEAVKLDFFPSSLASSAFIANRYFRLVAQKRRDFEYAVRMRAQAAGLSGFKSLRHRVVLSAKAVTSALVDFVTLVTRLQTIVNARGGLPHPKLWQARQSRQRSLVTLLVADMTFLSLLYVAIFRNHSGTLPDKLRVTVATAETYAAQFLQLLREALA